MAHEGLHEPDELLTPETRDLHRALVSLMEELEAVDWYQQRAEAASDASLRAVLAHNRDEEIEHAMMTLEWLRRRNPVIDTNARTYLFRDGPITAAEEAATDGASAAQAPAGADGSLGIGSLNPSSRG